MISYAMIFRLKNIGSKKATKSEAEAKVVSVMETLEILSALKKKIQCAAVIIPVPKYLILLRLLV